jgi:hypothetical protein
MNGASAFGFTAAYGSVQFTEMKTGFMNSVKFYETWGEIPRFVVRLNSTVHEQWLFLGSCCYFVKWEALKH